MSFETSSQPAGNIVTATAMAELGKPYVFGAAGPDSFDCSGLALFCYAKAGIKLPHYTVSQYAVMKHRPTSEAQPGDLIFFQDNTGLIHHVGIYVGNDMMINAPDWGIPVRYDNIHESDMMNTCGIYEGPGNTDGAQTAVQTADAAANPGTGSSNPGTNSGGTTAIDKGLASISTTSLWKRVGEGALALILLLIALHLGF